MRAGAADRGQVDPELAGEQPDRRGRRRQCGEAAARPSAAPLARGGAGAHVRGVAAVDGRGHGGGPRTLGPGDAHGRVPAAAPAIASA